MGSGSQEDTRKNGDSVLHFEASAKRRPQLVVFACDSPSR